MGWFKEQLISKQEVEEFITRNKESWENNPNRNETEKMFYPGRYVKLCLMENGTVIWVPGQVLAMSGTQDRCQMRVALQVSEEIYAHIDLDNTRAVGIDFEKEKQDGVA